MSRLKPFLKVQVWMWRNRDGVILQRSRVKQSIHSAIVTSSVYVYMQEHKFFFLYVILFLI